ncbi:hypothetical protein BCEN4_440040 [Burkholderia cenocepacia]|nr:hypothetical protein BCEN4_440040 [Burkholderia cenocepacia]
MNFSLSGWGLRCAAPRLNGQCRDPQRFQQTTCRHRAAPPHRERMNPLKKLQAVRHPAQPAQREWQRRYETQPGTRNARKRHAGCAPVPCRHRGGRS